MTSASYLHTDVMEEQRPWVAKEYKYCKSRKTMRHAYSEGMDERPDSPGRTRRSLRYWLSSPRPHVPPCKVDTFWAVCTSPLVLKSHPASHHPHDNRKVMFTQYYYTSWQYWLIQTLKSYLSETNIFSAWNME